ncbi:hypothetical protein NEAUS06_2616, partial [Nematocida ausubeli]
TLHLDRPIYRATSVFGHFGRSEFPWEQSKSLDISVVSAQENGTSHSLKK